MIISFVVVVCSRDLNCGGFPETSSSCHPSSTGQSNESFLSSLSTSGAQHVLHQNTRRRVTQVFVSILKKVNFGFNR